MGWAHHNEDPYDRKDKKWLGLKSFFCLMFKAAPKSTYYLKKSEVIALTMSPHPRGPRRRLRKDRWNSVHDAEDREVTESHGDILGAHKCLHTQLSLMTRGR